MKPILKVNNSELSFRLKLNYNNVYSRLKMLLGKYASIFADVSTKSSATTWFISDDAEYTSLSDAPKAELRTILVSLNNKLKSIKKELSNSPELAPFADDILEVPDNSYIFYKKSVSGYEFVLAGWGCKLAHTAVSDTGGIIKRISKTIGQDEEHERTGRKIDIDDFRDNNDNSNDIISDDFEDSEKENVDKSSDKRTGSIGSEKSDKNSDTDNFDDTPKPEEVVPKKKKEQHVIIRVLNQNQKPVEDESVKIRTDNGIFDGVTDENGDFDLGNLPYHSTFGVQFPEMPSIQERAFEVEPKVERYEVYIKKYVNYSPVLFVEDQNGNVVDNYNVKVVIAGQDTTFNTGSNGMIQLPTMQEGQKFIVIDSANYANSQEYSVTPENVKVPYHFTIKRTVKSKIGITVFDKDKKPMEGVTVDVNAGLTPCQQSTDKDGRAEFPSDVFSPGEVDLTLYTKGKGTIKSKLNFNTDTTEYSIQLQGKKPRPGFNWKWLMLLPLFLLLGGGGYWLYNKLGSKYPTIKDMETGVCLILGQGYYFVDLDIPNITVGGHPAVAYFNYDNNTKEVTNLTFNPEAAKVQGWWGTGFLISDDGLIATNKHIAAPAAPEEVANQLKKYFQKEKNTRQQAIDRMNDKLQILGGIGAMGNEYINTRDSLQYLQKELMTLDELINTGKFKVEVRSKTAVAFTGTRIEDEEDFIACSQPRAIGDPGGVTEKDLAIIQIKKKQDIPTDAFIFTIPEVDLMDGEIPDNYDITVLGYNAGGSLQDMELQEGIKPQAQHGKITNTSEKYRVGYDAPTIGGSSGSPVINNKGELVAINNSGLSATQGFNYGVRTKYLNELLDQLKKNNDKDKETNEK